MKRATAAGRLRAALVCIAVCTATELAASPAARAAAGMQAFAVIIGANHSQASDRPDLHYADDDAVRYAQIFETWAPGRVTLLTDLDRDSERLFPSARAGARHPTRAALAQVGLDIAAGVRDAARAGSETDVYFVFAGHGDVAGGTGFIELADGRFTSDDLEAWLRAIQFTRAHVVLDSCNSFFMLGARKPGGRIFATSEDAARALSRRLPNVGVFLSTSAEGETFEWSELQSGIFSHLVRSGLTGAGDADGDGVVSYLELAAFMATATADILNPNLRPHVYSRGPGGEGGSPLTRPGAMVGATQYRLVEPAAVRVRVVDEQDVPLLDTYKEAGGVLRFALPAGWTRGASIELGLAPSAGGGPPGPLQRYALPETAAEPLTVGALSEIREQHGGRGARDLYGRLLQRPFGPRAFAAYARDERAAPPRVYGVSSESTERMHLLLTQIATAQRHDRVIGAAAFLGVAGVAAAAGASALALKPDPDQTRADADQAAVILLSAAGLSTAYGTYLLASLGAGERAAAEYRSALASGGNPGEAFAVADERLREVARRETRGRWIAGIAGGVVFAASLACLVSSELGSRSEDDLKAGRIGCGTGMVVGGTLAASAALIASPVEQLTTIWQKDPGLLQFRPSVGAGPRAFRIGATFQF